MVVDKLDTSSTFFTIPRVRQLRYVVSHTANETRNSAPIPGSLKHPMEMPMRDGKTFFGMLLSSEHAGFQSERLESYLFQKRVCYYRTRNESIWVNRDLAISIENGYAQSNLLRTKRRLLHSGRVHRRHGLVVFGPLPGRSLLP